MGQDAVCCPGAGLLSRSVSLQPRTAIAQHDCEAQGGTVVGDIGDGATHRPEYVCPSGKPPLGDIAPPEGGPIAVEGAVCCPK